MGYRETMEQIKRTEETLALLKLIAMGQKDAEEGKAIPIEKAFENLRAKIKGHYGRTKLRVGR
jgi:hypothetical protein